jgi:integrase
LALAAVSGRVQVKSKLHGRVCGRGLPGFTAHQLRHTFGTEGASAGIPVADLRALMGHEDLSTTQQYIRPSVIRIIRNCAMGHLFHRPPHEPLKSGNQIKRIGRMRIVRTEFLRTIAAVEVPEVGSLPHHYERLAP